MSTRGAFRKFPVGFGGISTLFAIQKSRHSRVGGNLFKMDPRLRGGDGRFWETSRFQRTQMHIWIPYKYQGKKSPK